MPPTPSKGSIAASLLSRAHSPPTATRILAEKIDKRPLHLKATSSTPSARETRHLARLDKQRLRRKLKPAPLSARTKRALGIYDIPAAEQDYALYEPLHRMWVAYIHEVLGPTCMPVTGATAAKLVSADFHGAKVQVVRSRCVGRVGVGGIVVRDERGVFVVVVKGGGVKVLPKEHTVFRFEVPQPGVEDGGDAEGEGAEKKKNLVFELHGDQFQHRAVDRANKKFKPHHLPDL